MLVTGKNTHWGLFLGGGGEQLGLQCVALVVMILWSSSWSLLIYLVLSKFSALRLPLSKERQQFQERLDELARKRITLQSTVGEGINVAIDNLEPVSVDEESS
eukprot:TRINITY_DN7210_c0_g3_i5.p2 TRINITY_DN7210_c0_g3~~TRINITY_DN7210_c0_g3_i5.p2  ORF type:complete len:103 (+),score=27.14 TRINITY_DN7210_c0_g3_i5:420-728(+)